MKIRLLTSGLIVILVSCDKKQTNENEQNKISEKSDSVKSYLYPVKTYPIKTDLIAADSTDNSEIPNCDLVANSDFHSETGDFLKYIKKNGKIKIEWGNKQFKRTLKREYECDLPSTAIPSLRWTTSNYIGLGYGCGSPCWGLVILPLNPTDSIFSRMYDYDVDTKTNQVVYLDNEKYGQLTVENWKTGRKTEIKIKVQCDSAFPGYCIDSVKIQNGELFVKWKEFIRDKGEGKETSETFKVGQ